MTIFDDDLHNHEPDELDSLETENFHAINQNEVGKINIDKTIISKESSIQEGSLHNIMNFQQREASYALQSQSINSNQSSPSCNVRTSQITTQLLHTSIEPEISTRGHDSNQIIHTEARNQNGEIQFLEGSSDDMTRKGIAEDIQKKQIIDKIYTRDNIILDSDDVLPKTTNLTSYEHCDEQQNRLKFNDFEAKLTQQLLQNTEDSLKELYEIHDYYFTADKEEKLEMLKERCHKVLFAIDKIQQEHPMVYEQLSSSKRGRLAYIQGRAFDVFEAYNIEAETALTRAIKLNPTDVDAWNGLAHCFWKKQDFSSAYDCYKQALQNENNKISHREFSKLLRQLPTKSNIDAANNVKESLDHAKAAIKLDLLDPDSWFILGNAHLSLFFKVSPNIEDLNRALKAYRRAESNGGDYNPDLFFNRANVLRYKEELDDAISNYMKAHELDPSFNCLETVADIRRRALRTIQLIEKKGGLRPKRLKELCQTLSKVPHSKVLKELGDAYKPTQIADLSYDAADGKNKFLHLKKIIPLGQQNVPPESFLVTDQNGDVCALSIYHLGELAVSKFSEKDTITILNPFKTRITCSGIEYKMMQSSVKSAVSTHLPHSSNESDTPDRKCSIDDNIEVIEKACSNEQNINSLDKQEDVVTYDTIQLIHPRSILVNGAPLKSSLFSPAQIKLDAFDK